MSTELRIKLNEWLTNALYSLSQKTGMDYTNITRMALMEYIEKRLQPADYQQINEFGQFALNNAIFEWEHYNRIIKKYSEKKSNLFKKLFVVALRNYKKLGHTFFDDYKTDINRFKEVIWNEPGVIDLLFFMTTLNEIPLPDKDQYDNLLKDKKEVEYYNKKWNEIYDNLKKKIGLKKHENRVALIELKIDQHLHTDTDAMYFLYEKLKNNEPLPKSSGNETKTIPNVSMVDEGSLEDLIKKYGANFDFNDNQELDQIAKQYGTLAQIDNMIDHYQGTIDHEKNYMDKETVKFAKEQIVKWKEIRKEFIEAHKKNDKKTS